MSTNALPQPEPTGRPDTAHQILGRQLRALRESQGITLGAAARHIDGSLSKVTRMELGKVSIKDTDLNEFLTLYGVLDDEERMALLELNCRLNESRWWPAYSDTLPEWLCSYIALESIAKYIWTYEVRFIPGLLQTEAYAEAVISSRCTNNKRTRRLVDLRMRRQHLMLERKAQKLWAIIDHAALDDGLDDPGIMREQIEFLLQAADRPDVTIQVVKPGAGMHAARSNSFSILRLRGQNLSDVVYLEHLDRAFFLDDPNDSDTYLAAMNEIGVAADKPDKAQKALEKALDRIKPC
jgi:hypothetical protein